MKKSLLIFLIVMSQLVGFSQEWKWQNPKPQGNNLHSVKFIDANTGYAVGGRGTIIKTTDGGVTWTWLPSGTENVLYSVFATDANTAYVVGTNGTILKTTNGGTNFIAETGSSKSFIPSPKDLHYVRASCASM